MAGAPAGPAAPRAEAGSVLAVVYEDSLSKAADEDPCVLARIGFAERNSGMAPGVLLLPLVPLSDRPRAELWRSSRPVRRGQEGGLSFAADGEVLFGSLAVRDDGDIEAATFAAYQELLEILPAFADFRILRLWNFFSGINDTFKGTERYGLFCRGRHRALSRRLNDFESSLPAASAIGTRSPGLFLHVLATRRGAVQIENPRQLSAFHYPLAYAPRSPSFSRSVLAKTAAGGDQLFVSGTASIVGHVSRHGGDLAAQLDETLANLEALLAAASCKAGRPLAFSALRIYLRQEPELGPLRARIGARLGAAVPMVFLKGDICRRELLVEIEGLAA